MEAEQLPVAGVTAPSFTRGRSCFHNGQQRLLCRVVVVVVSVVVAVVGSTACPDSLSELWVHLQLFVKAAPCSLKDNPGPGGQAVQASLVPSRCCLAAGPWLP